jgi:hypothetical protein
VGALFLLGLRLKPRTSNVLFLAMVMLLILGLIYLSKVTMAMFGFILLLIALVIALIILLLRGMNKARWSSCNLDKGCIHETFLWVTGHTVIGRSLEVGAPP